jgi:chromosome segregation ATPase
LKRWSASLEQTALGLAEGKGWSSLVESAVAGLRAAMADGSANVEEAQWKVAHLKAQLSDCWPKINQDLKNLKRELGKLKGEMRELRVHKAAMVDHRLWREQEICDVKHEVELLLQASDG